MTETNVKTNWQERPPIVAVLGHVDHGKTSLLDRIRQSHIAEREAGGITQSIGAYKITHQGKEITFIDTPGHAAFTKMRSCGGQAADIVVLVVAADDGVKPQTIESIECIKTAQVPYVVAINKADLPTADLDRVKAQLAEHEVFVESYGGEIVALPVSAKTGQGIEELLEMLLLVAQINEIGSDSGGILQATIIESKKEKAGPVGTVVVKNGTLKVGDQILAGGVSAKIRGLMDVAGKRQNEIKPGEAAEVLGFLTPPPVGANVVKIEQGSQGSQSTAPEMIKIPKFTEEEEKKYKVIIKADTTGSLEAISASLGPDVLVVVTGIGEILTSDVTLAQMVKAKIYAFRVKVPQEVAKLAETEKVEIKIYEIIYKLLEELEEEVKKASTPEVTERTLGKAEIVAEFIVNGNRIAGCKVIDGRLTQEDQVHLRRDERLVGETKITSIKQRAKDVREVRAKDECGVILDPSLDFKVGDMLISYAS